MGKTVRLENCNMVSVDNMPERVVEQSKGAVKSETDLEVLVKVSLRAKEVYFLSWGETPDKDVATACLLVIPDEMVSARDIFELTQSSQALMGFGPIEKGRILLGMSW